MSYADVMVSTLAEASGLVLTEASGLVLTEASGLVLTGASGLVLTEASGLSTEYILPFCGLDNKKTPTILANVGVIKAASTYADVMVSTLTVASGLSIKSTLPF